MKWLLLALLASSANAQPVPYYSRSQNSNQDAGAGNANLRDITGRKRNNLVNTVGNATCGAGQALLGAAEKDGYIFGGTCTTVATGSASSTVTTSSPISGDGSSGSPVTLTGAVSPSLIDLSTVTTKFATKASSGTNADLSILLGAGNSVSFSTSVTVTSTLTVQGPSFSVGTSSFSVGGGSATVAYQLSAGSFLGVAGATETTTAALTGVGTAASPLGVNSSSVAVLSSGFILNSQIDPSSVTKQGAVTGSGSIIATNGTSKVTLTVDSSSVPIKSSGLILNSEVDATSVTKQGNQFNGASQLVKTDANTAITLTSGTFTGTGVGVFDLTLSSSIHFKTATTGIQWQDGSISTTASSGGGGSVSQAYSYIATGPVSGLSSFQFPQTSTIVFNSAQFGAVSSPTVNATIISLLSQSIVGVSSCGYVPTISAFQGNSTFATVTGSSLTWTSLGGYPEFVIKTHFLAFNNRDIICLRVLIDGGSNGSYTTCNESIETPSGGSNGDFVLTLKGTSSLTAGSHTATLMYNTSNASGVKIPQTVTGEEGSQFCASDSLPVMVLPAAGTVGAKIDNFIGQVNGSLKTFTLSNTPQSSSAVFVFLNGLLQSGASDYVYTYPTTITMTTAPASNSTEFMVQYFVNTSTLPAVALLNSTQTFTASQAFSSTLTATGQVHISTGFTINFPATFNFTTTAQSFTSAASVTGSTGSFVVQGTTVACWLTGSESALAGLEYLKVGFGVDGSVSQIPGTSSTVGVLSVWDANTGGNAGGSVNISVPPVEFQVSAGVSHYFWLGLWMTSGSTTITFPQANQDAIAQFSCREVPSR